MRRDLRVWTSEGESKQFCDVVHSYITGNHLLFSTEASGANQCGINIDEVICWEFVLVEVESGEKD
jgi:hypothetical protein